eukprot:4163098-Pyramimonas_sp.AAC.1
MCSECHSITVFHLTSREVALVLQRTGHRFSRTPFICVPRQLRDASTRHPRSKQVSPRVINTAEDRVAVDAFIVHANLGENEGRAVAREGCRIELVLDQLAIRSEARTASFNPAYEWGELLFLAVCVAKG